MKAHEIPLIFNDLSHPQTVQDIFFALEKLSEAFDRTLNKIGLRLTEERHRVGRVNERVSVCNGKIQLIVGSNRATTIFSTAKFPSSKTLMKRMAIFNSTEYILPYPQAEDDVMYVPAIPDISIIGNASLTNELHSNVAKLNAFGTEMMRTEFIMEDKGLGILPNKFPSVGSLLLFNSDINPYKNYQTLDNLMSTGRAKTEDVVDSKSLAQAPSTLVSGDALPDIEALDLTYKPQMGEMTALALPSNLPLDFLADIQYGGVALPSIAPSSHRGNNADYSLPQITDGTHGNPLSSAYAPGPSAKQPPQPPSTNKTVPPPPPPSTGENIPASVVSNSAPPPPPPPPPPINNILPPPPPTNNLIEVNNIQGLENVPPPAPGRASLLDSIKGMSVANLRSKEENQIAEAKVAKKEESKKPISMMDEFRLRMERRNNALSGKNSKAQTSLDAEIVKDAQRGLESNSLPIKKAIFPIVKDVDSESDTSEVSEVSMDYPKKKSSLKQDLPEQTQNVRVQPKLSAENITTPARRGSLLDPSHAGIANMINAVQKKADDNSSSDGGEDDWD